MDEMHSESRKQELENKEPSRRRVNWWGIFGLLCGLGSAYLSLRIFFEAMALLGNGP